MSAYDGTGPAGMGPMTGRGFGPCAMSVGSVRGQASRRGLGLGWRRRFGAGRGVGRCFGWGWPLQAWLGPGQTWFDPQTTEDRLTALGEYKKALKKELEDVEKEAEELSSKK